MYLCTKCIILLLHLFPENQVFSIGSFASRTQDSPARWGLATILHVVSTESLTMFDWLLSSMNSDVTTDDSEDYSVSSNLRPYFKAQKLCYVALMFYSDSKYMCKWLAENCYR